MKTKTTNLRPKKRGQLPLSSEQRDIAKREAEDVPPLTLTLTLVSLFPPPPFPPPPPPDGLSNCGKINGFESTKMSLRVVQRSESGVVVDENGEGRMRKEGMEGMEEKEEEKTYPGPTAMSAWF